MYLFMKKNEKKHNHVVNHVKKKNNWFFARFIILVNNFFSINIVKLDSSVKNTHYVTFLKIFDNLVTQERRLKDARNAKLRPLISKRAALRLVVSASS